MSLKIAVVTGANRGIGLEICRQLASQGIHVILTARTPEKGIYAVKKLAQEGCLTEFYPLDVTNSEQIQTLINYIDTTFGRLDILINNAGIYLDQHQPALTISAETILKAVETDVCGTFSISKAAILLMQKNNYGRIVNLSSTSSQIINMNDLGLAYKICKTSINVITAVLANTVKDQNILINSAAPGWIKTDMGGEQALLSIEEGADTPVWLATLPDNSISGQLFLKRKSLPW